MKKQFILIMTDTQRTDWLSCYGEKSVKTPRLQEFADEGLVFNRAYDCQAVCSPARSALFTGSYPHTNGMLGNDMYLSSNIKTLGERLTDRDIKTGYVGKWHLDGGDYFGKGECPAGWDKNYWYDMRCYLNELEPDDIPASRRFETIFREGFTREFTYGHRCAERAKDFIKENAHRDFFLVLSFDEPTTPLSAHRSIMISIVTISLPITKI
jgi:arylsulfatase A-like enzyme